MASIGTLAVGVATLLEFTVHEPPERVHPVVGFGRIVETFDRPMGDPLVVGTGIAVFLPLIAATIATGMVWLAVQLHPVLGGSIAGIILFTTISLEMLTDVATDVIDATETDLVRAKDGVLGLVGRETTDLSAAEIRSAAVESVAENLADGLVGPLVAFVIGGFVSVPVGIGAAVWVKAVNTLDSMLGYPDRPIGTASAHLDDVVEWIPARVSALLIAVAGYRPTSILRARRWSQEPASPNSGWPMATLAVTGDMRLRKVHHYDLNPVTSLPSPGQARKGIAVVWRAGVMAFVLAGVCTWM